MFAKLFKFERQLQFRQVSFWVVMFIMFLVGFAIIAVDWFVVSFEGGERVKVNGAFTLSNQISFLSFLAIFFASVFVVSTAGCPEVYGGVAGHISLCFGCRIRHFCGSIYALDRPRNTWSCKPWLFSLSDIFVCLDQLVYFLGDLRAYSRLDAAKNVGLR